jgi:hypothetical protein
MRPTLQWWADRSLSTGAALSITFPDSKCQLGSVHWTRKSKADDMKSNGAVSVVPNHEYVSNATIII